MQTFLTNGGVLLVKVLLTLNGLFYRAAPLLKEKVERLGAEFAFLDSNRLTRQDLLTHIKDVHIYIAGVEKADRELIDAAPELRYIMKFGAGIDNIDVEYANEKGILVTNAPGQNASAVADWHSAFCCLAPVRSRSQTPQSKLVYGNRRWAMSSMEKRWGLSVLGKSAKRLQGGPPGFI